MRNVVSIAIASLLLVLGPANAIMAQVPYHSATQATALDELFSQLTATTDEAAARSIADQIWRIWTEPEDATLAGRVREIIAAGGFAGPAGQMDLLDEIVTDYPDYAEGWNMRATANFLRGDYDASLADIAETLRLEPRHFGALAGQALILDSLGRRDEAVAAMRAALDIHPFLGERALFPELGPPPIRS